MCVCMRIYIYIYTHTHTHTYVDVEIVELLHIDSLLQLSLSERWKKEGTQYCLD